MTLGIWIFGDQLSLDHGALASVAPQRVPVLLIESLAYAQQRPYHRQKLVLVWSAMRHFAAVLRAQGWPVTYAVAEDFETPLRDWIARERISELRLMRPNDRPLQTWLEGQDLPCDRRWYSNNQFLWSAAAFQTWIQGRKRFLLEDFYRAGRRKFQVLWGADGPLGDRWNFDQENRQTYGAYRKQKASPPPPLTFRADGITQSVIARVRSTGVGGYGDLTENFAWGVTREQAWQVLQYFLSQQLGQFGSFQDLMVQGQAVLWHSLLSPYLNLGLLHPQEVIAAAEEHYHRGAIALNQVEGFIRQILGWREYMYGLYHHWGNTDSDPEPNFFQHHQPLPAFFWDHRQTEMNCVRQVLAQTEHTAYAHHIQRLMILSNFALLLGVEPREIRQWFHSAYIDAHDWVMQTNVLGMGQFADGGRLASKPYVASANYIHKMSNYCETCCYQRQERLGSQACPFNYLYWDFLDRHREPLQNQGRMGLILKGLDRLTPQEKLQIHHQATQLRQQLGGKTSTEMKGDRDV